MKQPHPQSSQSLIFSCSVPRSWSWPPSVLYLSPSWAHRAFPFHSFTELQLFTTGSTWGSGLEVQERQELTLGRTCARGVQGRVGEISMQISMKCLTVTRMWWTKEAKKSSGNWRCSSGIQYLPTMRKALGSIPSTRERERETETGTGTEVGEKMEIGGRLERAGNGLGTVHRSSSKK